MSAFRIMSWLAAAALVAASSTVLAQDFPTRPITLVAPYPAGSATDNVARPLAQALQEIIGQPVIVDNRAGAQGVIGAEHVARPLGHRLRRRLGYHRAGRDIEHVELDVAGNGNRAGDIKGLMTPPRS